MGKKLNSKNDLTAPTANLSCFRSKINKNTVTILGSFEVGKDLEHDENDSSSFNELVSLKSAKMVLRLTISKFSSFIRYICCIIFIMDKN
jgi:hypothetical protein